MNRSFEAEEKRPLGGYLYRFWVLGLVSRNSAKASGEFISAILGSPPYLLQCQIDRIVYSECISYQASLLRTCTGTRHAGLRQVKFQVHHPRVRFIPGKRSDPLTRVKLPHSLSRARWGTSFQTVRRFPDDFSASTRTFLRFPASRKTGSGLIRSLRLWRFLGTLPLCAAHNLEKCNCDWINICTIEL